MNLHHPETNVQRIGPVAWAADAAGRQIPPAWPLASSVAVNPFLGQSGDTLAETAARLARTAGVRVTMPREWYRERISSGAICDDDLETALAESPHSNAPGSVAELRAAAGRPSPQPVPVPTVADLAANVSGIDWPSLVAERIGFWAAGHFDEGQALWAAPSGKGAFRAWRDFAIHDLTPEIVGLKGFAAHVAAAPEAPGAAAARAADRLGLTDDVLESCFHRLLMTLGGWSQYARYRLWQAELSGNGDDTLTDLLAIRLVFEEALFDQYGDRIESDWKAARAAHGGSQTPGDEQVVDAILQQAADLAAQRELAARLHGPAPEADDGRPRLQAAFCIDVRSEVFRRSLEAIDPGIRTIGFAGFFGLGLSHRRFASDVEEARLPVLLTPALRTRAGAPDNAPAEAGVRLRARALRAWGRFKLAAVSSFAFVEATAPIYVGKLIRDALGLAGSHAPNDPAPKLDPALDRTARVDAAETVLRAMSLTENFAPLVLLAGHGANVVNNPHASALHCGACGGYSGEVNARLLAALLNDDGVRQDLAARGIEIPADTLFVGALHDTTTDNVTLYDGDFPSHDHRHEIDEAMRWLRAAGETTRAERALRLPGARCADDAARRSRDWAQVRPEWALAGCKAFIAAPRRRTAGRDLSGRAFLHDYDWRVDRDFSVLELIMTAPVVVASWISLQYYGSTVAPAAFGAGNKLLHNVTGGIGVVEGNGGLLRAGLPWQSVHDGERFMHDPVRLTVAIEAPCEAMSDILRRHPEVRSLFDNGWLHLVAIDGEGRLSWRYAGNLEWRLADGQTDRENAALAPRAVPLRKAG